jgi:phosphonate metabolism-associated iron-containing alcohol dehydrogenase
MEYIKTKIDFYNPVKIYFGRGERAKVLNFIHKKKCLIVCTKKGKSRFINDNILAAIENFENITWFDKVQENPDISELESQVKFFYNDSFDCLIAFGGGSAIDTAKVFALILGGRLKKSSINELLQDKELYNHIKPIPLYVIPTTSGTGSEVTPFATVWDYKNNKKLSFYGNSIFPYIALVDPDLTENLPIPIMISTGLDAINQAAESVWNINATQSTIEIAAKSLRLGLGSLSILVQKPHLRKERDEMAESSLLAGLAISHTKSSICHSISYPLTSHYHVPHGLACGFTMLAVSRIAIKNDDGRFKRLAEKVLGKKSNPDDLIAYLTKFFSDININSYVKPLIGSYANLVGLKKEMLTADRSNNFITKIDLDGIEKILEESWN